MSAPSAPPDGAAPATEVLRFEPWQSAVDPTFWAELARRKLDTFGLSEDPVAVDAQFACATHASVSSPAQLDARAFEPWSATAGDAHASGRRRMPGSLVNVNTFERFKAFDRVSMLKEAGDKVWRAVASGAALRDPNALNAFSVLAFADLKSWQFSYWFCFPALKLGTGAVRVARRFGIDARLASSLDARLRDAGASDAFAWATRVWFEKDASEHPLDPLGGGSIGGSIRNVLHAPLTEMNAMLKASRASSSDASSDGSDVSRVFLSFADACSNPDHPGWALRNLATLAAARFDLGDERRLSVISVRTRAGRVSREHSRVFELVFAKDDAFAFSGSDENDENDKDLRESTPNPFPVVGWELNPRGRAGPRRADLGESMDPTRLAVAAAELNLKLMRWRLLPELDLERVTKTKCLLIGAGTLGCAVARTLLGWGVREFTFVDSGRVSFSNPTRQSLFEFADCLDGGKPKAEAAAANLARVFPGVLSRGVAMAVPMPGHPVSGDDATRALADVERLEALVKTHDAVFCLTDTRESRWLPTLLCAANDVALINAALGFDSYLVMRHGGGTAGAVVKKNAGSGFGFGDEDERGDAEDARLLSSRLGCYFCNDVMAPGDSTRDRTLDQQCTVTRPGLAPIAGALAAEMLVALRHWRGDEAGVKTEEATRRSDAPKRRPGAPPAHVGAPRAGEAPPTPLGIVPHQIRGHVSTYAQSLFAAPAFDKCTACSETVVRAFRGRNPKPEAEETTEDENETAREKNARDAFLLAAFADPTFLEDATGLTEVHRAADDAEWLGGDTDGDDF